MEEIEKIVMIVDSIDDAQLLVSCMKETTKEKVSCVCINGDIKGITEIEHCPVVGIAQMPPLDQLFMITYSHDFEDLKGPNIFNIYEYDLFWSKLSPEHYMIIEDFERNEMSGIKTLVVGMSYIQRGLNLDMTDGSVVTLASPTQDVFYDIHNFHWAEKNGAEPDTVIYELASYRLWYDLSLSNNRVRCFYYYPQAGSLHHFDPGIDTESFFTNMKKTHDSLFSKDVIREINDRRFHDDGYDTDRRLFGQKKDLSVFGSLSKDERDAFAPGVKRLYDKPYEATYDENTALIQAFVEELCEKQIRTVFVLPPFPEVFLKNMDMEKHNRTLEFLNEIKRSHPEVEIRDFTNDEDFDDEHFSDWCHLNYYGACMLTEKLFKTGME